MAKLRFPPPFEHRHPTVEVSQDVYAKTITLGQRAADFVARTVGSWPYIIIQSSLVLLWCVLNVTVWVLRWDPYPFIFLNLIFSIAAAYTAPLIMMSQNRQDQMDRIDAHNDYMVNQRVEEEIRVILEHLDAQNEALTLIYRELEDLKNPRNN